MSLFLETKYIGLASSLLKNFKQKSPNLYNFSCFVCGDSHANKKKARGYLIKKGNTFRYFCHNCNASYQFDYFLRKLDEQLHDQYRMERFGSVSPPLGNNQVLRPTRNEAEEEKEVLLDKVLEKLGKLPQDHEAVVYCLGRKIPKAKYDALYYIDDVAKLEHLCPSYKDKITSHEPRIVFPFYNRRGRFIGVTCRAIYPHQVRYMVAKVLDTDEPMIYNLDKVDFSQDVYVVEGPIDSLFLPNCLAAGGSDFKKIGPYLNKSKTTAVFDNQPRNKFVVREMAGAIERGYKVCIWPENIIEKDINEMILNGRSAEYVKQLIDDNSVSGLSAKVRLAKWKRYDNI